MFRPEDFNHYSTYFLAHEAEKKRIKVEKIFPKTKLSYLKLEKNGQVETIIGQRISKLSYNSYFICHHKDITRKFLRENGVKTTEGKYFTNKQIGGAKKYIRRIGFPIVVKPVDATWGRDVYLDIRSMEDANKYIKKILENRSKFLIEKQFFGNEYRILATRKKLLGIINRIPANVIGDGKHTINGLINIKNKDPRRGEKHENSLVKIEIDQEVIKNLRNQKLILNSVIKKGKTILLRKNSNISTGGDSFDVTDIAHPKIKKLAPKVISAIPNLPYAGFDFMTPDITKDPDKVGYAVIEINDSPMLSMHHEPYVGKKRNVAKEIINIVFSN